MLTQQENKHIILSICVPTYNRYGYLRECLTSILSSAKDYEEKIQIVILDNASTDDTEIVVEEFQKIHPWIQYHRNAENIGPERNFYRVAQKASSEYIWIFSDDDKMEGNAISTIINRIELGYNLIICNYSLWSNDFSRRIKQRYHSIDRDETFSDPNELMRHFGISLGLISGVVIQKELFLKIPYAEYEAYAEYGLSFLYSVYASIFPNCNVTYIAAPIVCQRGFDKASDDIYNWYKVFAIGASLVLEALGTKGYAKRAIHHAKQLVLKDYILHDISYRKRHRMSLDGIFDLILRHYKKCWFFWVVCVPGLFAPRFLVWIANKIVLMARKLRI